MKQYMTGYFAHTSARPHATMTCIVTPGPKRLCGRVVGQGAQYQFVANDVHLPAVACEKCRARWAKLVAAYAAGLTVKDTEYPVVFGRRTYTRVTLSNGKFLDLRGRPSAKEQTRLVNDFIQTHASDWFEAAQNAAHESE